MSHLAVESLAERHEAEEAERQRFEHELDYVDRMHRELHRGIDGPSLGL
ncbi:hypothetical protein HUO13_28075 [Saccharopolyspora erythraea]|nr:hypothetical protein [Saccharopolyspora erythraea]QUH04145.1 hypothetical protein HUO13_28075 [Saccharopolyspora erythraea]